VIGPAPARDGSAVRAVAAEKLCVHPLAREAQGCGPTDDLALKARTVPDVGGVHAADLGGAVCTVEPVEQVPCACGTFLRSEEGCHRLDSTIRLSLPAEHT
jgi:hypothetical protein